VRAWRRPRYTPCVADQRPGVCTNVTIELGAQTILAHAHRGLGRYPERRAQPGVAVLGEPADAAEAARLLSREAPQNFKN
jgi:hypothetical protein